MLKIYVEGGQLFNNETNEFVYSEGETLFLEHSLISLSKWESKWHKAFIGKVKELTDEEMVDYIRCMAVKPPKNDNIFYSLSNENYEAIQKYINDPMTATTIHDRRKGPARGGIVTTELIYYWMIKFGIPIELEKWHINRLMTLIRVCDIKGSQGEKGNSMSRREALSMQKALNDARRAKHGGKG